MVQDITWYGGRPRPRPHCVRWGRSSLENGTPAPTFRHMSVVAKRSPISVTAELFFSERELTFAFAICCRPSVCLSVCLSISLIHPKFHGDRPRGTLPTEELNTRGVVKYSDFGPIDGCISETVQDRR